MAHKSEAFKQSLVQKALLGNGRSLKSLAQEHDVGYSTHQKWLKAYRKSLDGSHNQFGAKHSRAQRL